MNISLTTLCNNHCPYCFQEDWRLQESRELPFEDFVKILDWSDEYLKMGEKLGLLGGEPTIYSHFEEALNLISERYPGNEIVIFTNLLCSTDTIDIMAQHNCAFLINSTFDDDKEERFYKNLDYLCQNTNLSNVVTIGLTLYENHQQSRIYLDRAIDIIQKYPIIPSIRIGLSTPNSGLSISKVENYDDDVLYILKRFDDIYRETGKICKISFDCPVNFCALSLRAHNLILGNFDLFYNKESFKCNCPVLDILPDLTITYCASSGDKWRQKKITDFKDTYEAIDYFTELNTNYQHKNKKCTECELLNNVCYPCHCTDESLCGGNKQC